MCKKPFGTLEPCVFVTQISQLRHDENEKLICSKKMGKTFHLFDVQFFHMIRAFYVQKIKLM